MPFAEATGARIFWRSDGAPNGPPLLLLNSIGTDLHSFDDCLPFLAPRFCIVRMDTRGHGKSDAPPGDYHLSALAQDVIAVMDAAGLAKAAIAGVSLGGMMAMQLALDHPARVNSLIVICSSATIDAPTWSARVAAVRKDGTAKIAQMAMERYFSPAFAMSNAERVAEIRKAFIEMSDHGYAGAGAAIRDMAIATELWRIKQSMLVIAGDRDISTPFEGHGRFIVDRAPKAAAARVDAAHLAQIEAPEQVAALIREFVENRA